MTGDLPKKAVPETVSLLGQIEAICDRFEAAWNSGQPPSIEQYLADTPELVGPRRRRELLLELVMIDLERRWRAAQGRASDAVSPQDCQARDPLRPPALPDCPLLEDYVRRFPELGPWDQLPDELIATEYRVRHCWGDRPEQEEYRRRFPGRGTGLTQVLASAMTRQASLSGRRSVRQSPAEPSVSRELGEYRLLEKLGEGGMGSVYKALHTKLGRTVAIKVLPRAYLEDEQAIARFEREMKAVGAVDHPNLVRAYDAREIQGTRFLVTEYVEGQNLRDLVDRRGPLPVGVACELIRQAALGLQSAHEHGLVHRDIKPSNLMLSETGQLKILDLGLAKLRSDWPTGRETTETGGALGTPDYMAPEQASDRHSVDIRADIYSLGCTLYALLAGSPPFSDPQYPGAVEKLFAHAHQPVPPIHLIRTDVPQEVLGIVTRMLSKEPGDRFATPAGVADAIGPFAAGEDAVARWARTQSRPIPPPPLRDALEATRPPQASGLTPFLRRLEAERRSRSAHRPLAAVRAGKQAKVPSFTAWIPLPRSCLVLRWPQAQRAEAKLEIDGRPRDMAAEPIQATPEQVKVPLPPGSHRLWIACQESPRKSELMIPGPPGNLAKAAEAAISVELDNRKSESLRWETLGRKATQRLLSLAVDPQSADEQLAAGLLALACHDTAAAERYFAQANSRGLDIGPYLAPLAAASLAEARRLLAEAQLLIERKRPAEAAAQFQKAADALANIEQNYTETPWFVSNKRAFDAARAEVKTGITEAEAERLYAQAARLFSKRELFEVKPLTEQLKNGYPDTRAVTDLQRKPSFAQMQKAVASLGKFITVRLDGKGDFKSIQAAIDAAPPNSLIEIQDSGRYAEMVNIPKRKEGLTLRGKQGSWPIILSGKAPTNFPQLVTVGAPQTTLERLILIHNAVVEHKLSDIVQRPDVGALRIRSCIFSFFHNYEGTAVELDNCVVVDTLSSYGTFVARDSQFLRRVGASGPSTRFQNSFVLNLDGLTKPGDELRSCTITKPLTLGSGTALVNCIVSSVASDRPDVRIEHCHVYDQKIVFGNQANPPKEYFGPDPQFVSAEGYDYRLVPTSPCRGKASDGGDLGVRYTPEMLEMLKLALELRRQGLLKF